MKPKPQGDVAAVLVFAVLLLAAGVFVLTGIAQLAATQALIGQSEWQALDRRVRLENSRAMARQFMLARMFNGVVAAPITFVDTSLGGFSLSPISSTNAGGDYWTTLSTTNTNVNLKINPFTLMERGGFYRVVVPGTIYDGTNDVQWNFQVRTRSPIAAGYPYVQHRPGTVIDARDRPYMDMNLPERVDGFAEMPRMVVSSVTNTNLGGGYYDTNGYVGFLGVPVAIQSPIPFQNTNVPTSQVEDPSKLQIEVDLATADPGYVEGTGLSRALTYTVPNVANLTRLVLKGTDGDSLLPLQIVIPEDNTNVQTLVLSGRNSGVVDSFSGGRPVYVHWRRAPGSAGTNDVVSTNFTGPWRIGISSQHRAIAFQTQGLTIIGGVRSDGLVTGNPDLRREINPLGLDYVADRMMWLEDHKTP